MSIKKRGLAKGRGLDALLGSIQKEKLQLEAQALDHGQLKQIDVKLLKRVNINHVVLSMSMICKSWHPLLKNMG